MRINIEKLEAAGFEVVQHQGNIDIQPNAKHSHTAENVVGNIMDALGDRLSGTETEQLAYEVVTKHQNRVILALCE